MLELISGDEDFAYEFSSGFVGPRQPFQDFGDDGMECCLECCVSNSNFNS